MMRFGVSLTLLFVYYFFLLVLRSVDSFRGCSLEAALVYRISSRLAIALMQRSFIVSQMDSEWVVQTIVQMPFVLLSCLCTSLETCQSAFSILHLFCAVVPVL